MFVTLSSVFNYLSENADSRCLKEGEELLNANHVLLLGATEETEEYVEVAENVLLERLSTTDTRCYWSNKKKAVEQHYEATPILETECYKKQVKDKEPLISVQKKRCFDLLLSLYPESSLACHM
nr:unnamed protein product [Callosobruchus analis]